MGRGGKTRKESGTILGRRKDLWVSPLGWRNRRARARATGECTRAPEPHSRHRVPRIERDRERPLQRG
eukprot:scaffold183868_cov35-Tisochrysis_lutea.AAC.2